jgi:hypothetical protein
MFNVFRRMFKPGTDFIVTDGEGGRLESKFQMHAEEKFWWNGCYSGLNFTLFSEIKSLQRITCESSVCNLSGSEFVYADSGGISSTLLDRRTVRLSLLCGSAICRNLWDNHSELNILSNALYRMKRGSSRSRTWARSNIVS